MLMRFHVTFWFSTTFLYYTSSKHLPVNLNLFANLQKCVRQVLVFLVCNCVFFMSQLRPNFADAWSNLANAYMRNGRVNEAVQCCRQALELNPNQVIFLVLLDPCVNYVHCISTF